MKRLLLAVAAVAIAAAAFAPFPPVAHEARAAATNVPVGAGQVMVFPFHVTGTVSSTVTGSIKFNMPQPCQLIGAGASARTVSGTLTTDVLVGGASIMSSAIAITAAGTFTEGTIGTPAIADEAAVSVNLTPSGSTPTFADVTVLLTCARR